MWIQQPMWVKRNEHGVIIAISDNPPSAEDFIPTMQSDVLADTGIVRRIDDLGRVVIPKSIRAVMRLLEGDPITYLVDASGNYVIRKYEEIK